VNGSPPNLEFEPTPIGGWLGDRLGSRMLCTAGSAVTALSMFGFARMDAGADSLTVMAPLMMLGLGWSLFQAPNLSGMFNAAGPRNLGAVSGLSLTSANIGNAMGVAIGSVLFLRWLNHEGIAGSAVPPYTQWTENSAVFINAFQKSWLIITALAAVAILTSALRGVDKRGKEMKAEAE